MAVAAVGLGVVGLFSRQAPSSVAKKQTQPKASRPAAVRCCCSAVGSSGREGSQQDEAEVNAAQGLTRRSALAILGAMPFMHGASVAAAASTTATAGPSFPRPPPGLKRFIDRLDGYTFTLPEYWIQAIYTQRCAMHEQVRGSGSDVFFRNPDNLDENLFVSVSSPSSSKFAGVEDLGTPQEAGERTLKQYLTELMSTRLGVRREAELLSTAAYDSEDGRKYYTYEISAKSFVNSNQLAVNPEARQPYMEWDRRYLYIAGCANNRLYELRLQVPIEAYAEEKQMLADIMDSFRTFTV
eukprot:jgi/Chlat1/538/Chrsp103S01001